MDPPAVLGGGRAVSRGPDEWMGKRHAPAHLEESRVRRGAGRIHLDAERLGGPAEQQRVAEGLRGRDEDEQLSIGGQREEASEVALFDLAGYGLTIGQAEPAGEIAGAPGARQLEERKRVAVALRDDLVAHLRVEWTVHVTEQQRPGIALAEAADRQHRQSGEDFVSHARASRAHERDALGEEPAGDEGQNLRGRLVEPLCVVDDAGQRLVLGGLRYQGQRGESHQKPVGCRTGAHAEHCRERVALRDGQPVQVVQHGRAQLMEAAVAQLHLRLHADG